MEKEMKKLLLVAVSVGFFLLVTITVAIIVLTPKTKDTAIAANIPYSNGRVQNDWNEVPTQTPAQTEIVSSQEPEQKTNIIETDKNDGNNLTIIVPVPTTETVADTVQTSEKPKAPEQPVVAVKTPEPVAKPAQTASATKPATTTKPAATAKSSTPAKSTKTINDFWVQTGAFAAQVRAEDARELLATKGITSIIENREINGKVWYRVRLGPYTSEREANHWLEIVKLIDGFDDSQIRQTARAQ
ncbi:SPOR domain-containing protein [Treponema sp. R6D11]